MREVDPATRDAAAGEVLAALAPRFARLGVHGLQYEAMAREAVTVVARRLEAADAVRLDAAVRAAGAAAAAAALAANTAAASARADAGQLRVAVLELGGQLAQVTAERDAALTRARLLAGQLAAVEALPYSGAEPAARRIAREALAR